MLTNCLAPCAHLTITVSEIQRDICEKKSSFYHTPLHSTPPLGGFPSEYRHSLWDGKTRVVSLPSDGGKISKVSLFVLTRSTNVTDRQTDRQTPGDSEDRAYASHRAVKTIQVAPLSQRQRDASCLSVGSFNNTKRQVESLRAVKCAVLLSLAQR